MTRAKILFIHGAGEIGGAECDLLRLLSRINQERWDPIVVCPPSGPLINEIRSLGISVFQMHFPAWRKLGGFFGRIPARISLGRILDDICPALVHVNDIFWAPLAYLAGQRRNIPSVVFIRQQLKPKRVNKYFLDKVNHVIVVSKEAAEILKANKVMADNISIIPSGVDWDYFQSITDCSVRATLGIPSHSPVIGCLANVSPVKGYDYLIRAFAKVSSVFPDTHCLIIGREELPYGREIRKLATRLGVAGRIHFVGFQHDVRPFLELLDVVVLFSRAEALGISILEAMAMAKPIVASRVGGVPEVIEEGKTGLLVNPGNVDEMNNAILRLLRNPDEGRRLGEAGQLRIKDHFTLDQTVLAIVNVYEELIRVK